MSPGVFTGIFPSGNYGPPPGFCFDQFCNDEPINDDTVLHVRRSPSAASPHMPLCLISLPLWVAGLVHSILCAFNGVGRT
jgi:hypothetical protein